MLKIQFFALLAVSLIASKSFAEYGSAASAISPDLFKASDKKDPKSPDSVKELETIAGVVKLKQEAEDLANKTENWKGKEKTFKQASETAGKIVPTIAAKKLKELEKTETAVANMNINPTPQSVVDTSNASESCKEGVSPVTGDVGLKSIFNDVKNFALNDLKNKKQSAIDAAAASLDSKFDAKIKQIEDAAKARAQKAGQEETQKNLAELAKVAGKKDAQADLEAAKLKVAEEKQKLDKSITDAEKARIAFLKEMKKATKELAVLGKDNVQVLATIAPVMQRAMGMFQAYKAETLKQATNIRDNCEDLRKQLGTFQPTAQIAGQAFPQPQNGLLNNLFAMASAINPTFATIVLAPGLSRIASQARCVDNRRNIEQKLAPVEAQFAAAATPVSLEDGVNRLALAFNSMDQSATGLKTDFDDAIDACSNVDDLKEKVEQLKTSTESQVAQQGAFQGPTAPQARRPVLGQQHFGIR